MNLKFLNRPETRFGRRRLFVGAWLALLLLAAAPLFAADSYFAANQLDSLALLPPPPTLSEAEQAADLA